MKNKAQIALVWFANNMMQIPEYCEHWGAEFCVKKAKEYQQKLKEYLLTEVDFKKMSIDELIEIGFSFWTENLLLCPLWLADTLFPDVDHDHRGGLIAFGFCVQDGKLLFEPTKI